MYFLYLLIFALIAFVVSDALPVIDMHGLKGYYEKLKRNPDWRQY